LAMRVVTELLEHNCW